MRILQVNHQATFQGGVERVVFDTAKSLSEQGWPQALLHESATADADFCAHFSEVSSDISLLKRFDPDVILIHKCENPDRILQLAAASKTVRMVHDHDMVCLRRHKYFPLNTRICHKPAGLNCYTHLCFIQKAPTGASFPVRFATLSAQQKTIKANKTIDAFIVGSPWMQEELVMNGFNADSVHVIPPIPASLATVQQSPVPENREILFVGQVIKGKGVDLMLQGLARLEGDWHATIAGTGNHLDVCKSLAEKLHIADRVTFAGWIDHDQLNDYYRKARFLVVPSRWPEPFGMVGIEAMARGRAVVAFGVGGIPSWLEHGKTGLVLNEADVVALAEAMQSLLDNPARAVQMGQSAAEEVAKRFGHDHYIGQMTQLLENIA